MKNYSSNRAQSGKTAYRTPSRFKVKKSLFDQVKFAVRDKPLNSGFSFFNSKTK